MAACVLALLLTTVVALPGCQILAIIIRLFVPDTKTYYKEYDLSNKTIVVIPFKDQQNNYFDSQTGIDLANAVVGEFLQWRKETKMKDVKDAGQVRLLFPNRDLASVGWANVGRQVGAQLVLVGDIQRFTLRDPGTIGLVRGTCRLNFTIIDVDKGGPAFAKQLAVYCPDRGAGIAESSVDMEEFRQQLLAQAAHSVVKTFYTYEEKIQAPPTRY